MVEESGIQISEGAVVLDAVEEEPLLAAIEVNEVLTSNLVSRQETVEPKVESIVEEKVLVAEQIVRVEPTIELVSKPENTD